MRSRRPLVAIAIALALTLGCFVSSADAYVIHGSRWPGSTITYHAVAYHTAVDRAAKDWNNADIGVRFKRVSSSQAADVVVKLGATQCEGFSIVGFNYWHQSWVRLGQHCNRELMTLVATHEFGHTLGLGHEQGRCARMNAVVDFDGTPEYCRYHPLSYWLQHALKGDDVAGARALYRGSVRRSSAKRAPVSR